MPLSSSHFARVGIDLPTCRQLLRHPSTIDFLFHAAAIEYNRYGFMYEWRLVNVTATLLGTIKVGPIGGGGGERVRF